MTFRKVYMIESAPSVPASIFLKHHSVNLTPISTTGYCTNCSFFSTTFNKSSYLPTMDQINPEAFQPGSPNEFVLFLDTVITSSLCPHTKDWICFLYLDLHQDLCQLLNFSMHAIPGNDLFVIQYGGREYPVVFCVDDLVTYLQDLPRSQYQILRPAEARVTRRMFTKEWDLVAEKIIWRIPLPIRIETPGYESYITLEYFNPAVWFALQGKYTIADFLADRSVPSFIEDHWRRLSLQFGSSPIGKWEYHNAVDSCRCPGYTLPHLLVDEEANKAADAIMDEILSHVDSLIVDQLRPWMESFEEERRRASVHSLQNWYQPQGSARTWNFAAYFPALEAVSNRLLGAFEELRRDNNFRLVAEAWIQVM